MTQLFAEKNISETGVEHSSQNISKKPVRAKLFLAGQFGRKNRVIIVRWVVSASL